MYPILPNNRLILNGHRIHTVQQLFSYIAKRLRVLPFEDLEVLKRHLSHYDELIIAVRHADTFLQDESGSVRKEYIDIFHMMGKVVVSGTLYRE